MVDRLPRLSCALLGLAAMAAAGPALAQDRHGEDLKGPAFSDPGTRAEKPGTWIERRIEYGKWAKGARVAVTLDQRQYFTLLPVVKEYARANNIDIAVNEGTCGQSEGLLGRKKVDIGGFCCPPADYDRLPGLRFHTVGIGALAIVVHEDNPIENLTLNQVRQIFQGRIKRWSDLETVAGIPGPDIPIRPIARLHCKLRPGHWRLILDNENDFGAHLAEVGTPPDQIIEQLAGYTGGVGYEAVWNIDRFRHKGRTKAVAIDGVSPYDFKALISGAYPLYRVYNLTTWEQERLENGEADKLVRHLIDTVGEADMATSPYFVAPAARLREAGWKFAGDELIGEPD